MLNSLAEIIVYTSGKKHILPCETPVKIDEFLNQHNLFFHAACGGNHTCGKCKIRVEGAVSSISQKEAGFLTNSEIENHIRLACFCEIKGDAKIFVDSVNVHSVESNDTFTSSLDKDTEIGVVIDIGTTTIAGRAYDLYAKKCLKQIIQTNPQIGYGMDVITRIAKANLGKFDEMSALLKEYVFKMIQTLAESNTCKKTVIVGNTTMLSFFAGVPVETLGVYPFQAVDLFGRDYLETIYLAPCASAFVGGDAMAAAYISRKNASGSWMLADIGTNGEILLALHDKLYATSTAAGPALEGYDISCGMPAESGAISQVYITNNTLCYTVINGGIPKGICGSGLVDLLAVLGSIGMIDSMGRFQKNGLFDDCISEKDGLLLFKLPGTELFLTQQDMGHIQVAKATVCTAMEQLFSYAKISPSELDNFFLAGGFGTALSVPNMEKIGLIPKGIKEKAVSIGNAAVEGGSRMLFSKQAIEDCVQISKKTETIILNNTPDFERKLIENMKFSEFGGFCK